MSKFPGRIVSNLAPAGYSVFFDGTGDYLTWSGSTVGAGAFTFECWFYYTGTFSGIAAFVGPGTAVTNALNLYINNSTQLTFDQYGVTGTQFTVPTMVANQWYHVAFVRNAGGSATVFLNGVRSSTGAVSITTNYASIGAIGYVSSAVPRPWIGYLSNVRYTTAAVYDPTATTINVPTQLLNVTNTQLLTCNSPAIIDQSNNAFAITANGNAAVSTLTPFTAYVPYNPALGASTPGVWTVDEAMQAAATRQWNMYDPYFNLTTLLLHGNQPAGVTDTNNNTFKDSSTNNFTITRNGNTTQGTFSPFSQTGWSNFFDGTGDYLSAAYNSAFAFPGDFTIEFWVNWSAHGTSGGFVTNMQPSGGAPAGWQIVFNGANDTVSLEVAGSYPFITSSSTLPKNTWAHVAVVRSGSATNNVKMYFDGVQVAQGTNTSTLDSTNASLFIGCERTGGAFITGYISNVRIVKGTAVYTTAFTPPAAPLTAITNTSLLTCQSNRFIDNSTNAFAITRNGDVSVQAFSPFLPTVAYTPQTIGGSGYFDGSGDYLTVPSNTAFEFGSGNFTMEFSVYGTTSVTSKTFLQYGQAAVTGWTQISWGFGTDASNFPFLEVSNGVNNPQFTITSNTALRLNEWNHLAVVRSGTDFRIYLNGVSVASTTSSFSLFAPGGTVFFWIARAHDNAAPRDTSGYISNLRVVKGAAVYTGAFTPPRAPLATSGAASASAYPSTTNVDTSFAASATSLLCNFTNAGVVDSTADNVLETVGNAQISTTQSRFGGSSIAFDGTGDWLESPSIINAQFGTGDFTIEGWLYINSLATLQALFDFRASSGPTYGQIYITTGGVLRFYLPTDVGTSNTFSTGVWTHFAITRAAGTLRMFIGGVQGYSASYTSAMDAARLRIGAGVAGGDGLNAYVDDLRITKGFARYTGNFTPQTSQWQDQ